jgi:outer membrane protein TolC
LPAPEPETSTTPPDFQFEPESQPEPATPAPEPATPPGLSLRSALGEALGNAPDLEVSRLAPAIAQASLERERAGWDTRIEGSLQTDDNRTPATSNVDRVVTRETTSIDGEMRVVQPNPTGGELSAGWTQGRAATNSTRVFRNPTYSTAFQVRYAQPLLRGGGRRFTRRGVNLAEVDLQVQRWNLRRDILEALGATERAYWNLAAAQERVHVATLNLRDAETLLERSRYRVDAGNLAGVALLEADAAVAERRDLLLVAEREAQVAHNALVALVSPPPRPGFQLPALTDLPGAELPPVPAAEETIGQALESAPAYRAAIEDLRSRKIELAFSRDALQPRLDLVASMTANGVEDATAQAISDASSLDFRRYFVGLEFALPLGRRAARAETRRRSLELERALRQVKAQELELEGRVLDLIQRYRTDSQRLAVSRRRVDAARAKVEAEEQRFHAGLLNADDVLRFQADLASARGAEVGARAQASISAMEIWLAAGTLLGRRGIVIDETDFALDRRPTP